MPAHSFSFCPILYLELPTDLESLLLWNYYYNYSVSVYFLSLLAGPTVYWILMKIVDTGRHGAVVAVADRKFQSKLILLTADYLRCRYPCPMMMYVPSKDRA